MSNSGWRVVVEHVDGRLRALCKIQTLSDGGYSVICPYHSAREGWMLKLPIGPGYGSAVPVPVSLDEAVHYSATDRVKLSHHRDGLVQFSSEVKGKIRSGVDPITGKPKGIGVFSAPIDLGVPSGPAFGVTVWGFDAYREVEAPRKSDRVFLQEELYHFMSTPSTFNSYVLEGWIFGPEMWHGVCGKPGDLRIQAGGLKFGYSMLATREFRVIPLVGTDSLLGLQVSRTRSWFPPQSGFLLGGPREWSEEANQIIATYPAPEDVFASSENLDYS